MKAYNLNELTRAFRLFFLIQSRGGPDIHYAYFVVAIITMIVGLFITRTNLTNKFSEMVVAPRSTGSSMNIYMVRGLLWRLSAA